MKRQMMPMTPLTTQALRDNLKDAGCPEDIAESIMRLECSGSRREQLRLLADHRQRLLEDLHRAEKHIDCLDYLVYQLQRQEKEER